MIVLNQLSQRIKEKEKAVKQKKLQLNIKSINLFNLLQYLKTKNTIMGGTTYVTNNHYITEYKMDPQIEKQLAQLRAQRNDPQKAPAVIKKMKELIFANLARIQFPKSIIGKSIILIGRTSTGKSSLLNTLFKSKLPTSKGSCTKQIQMVQKYSDIRIFDCPGFDTHFEITKNPELIPRYLGKMDQIYYLYDSNVEQDIVRICLAMRKKIYGVRTKCDPDDQPQENQQVKVKDYAEFQKYGLKNPRIFFTSKKGGSDNGKLLAHMLS